MQMININYLPPNFYNLGSQCITDFMGRISNYCLMGPKMTKSNRGDFPHGETDWGPSMG